MSYDILQKADHSMVELDPFPHLVIDDALPQELYDRLAASYPDPERMPEKYKSMNNQRYNLLSRWGATEFPFEDASADWRAFVEANESTAFVEKAFSLFPDYLAESSGLSKIDLSKFGPDLPTKIKTEDVVAPSDMKPRVTVAVNTPATAIKSVRGVHTDNARKAYVGLLYFRLPEDDSTGGDLEIFRWKEGARRSSWPVAADPAAVELVKTIEYRPNRLIFFLATDNALHGVSPRSITPSWRRLVVISGWFPGVDYFDTDTMHGHFSGIRAQVGAAARRLLGKQRVTAD